MVRAPPSTATLRRIDAASTRRAAPPITPAPPGCATLDTMSPFREPPSVQLGPLRVGLGRAAQRAMKGVIPSGGRLLAPEPHERGVHGDTPRKGRSHTAGALGSLGLLLVGAGAFVAATSGWRPQSGGCIAITMALVIAGGLSLAAVLRAIDAPCERRTLRGDLVGKAARRALQRAQRLARDAARSPERFGQQHIRALRRTLDRLADPLIVDWIPADVRGRAELLLARAIAASVGTRWIREPRLRTEICSILLDAESHLDEPTPARSDLLKIVGHESAATRAQRSRRGPVSSPKSGVRFRLPRPTPARFAQTAGDGLGDELDEAEPSGGRAVRATVRR
jgi:hypothetical protein